MFLIVAFRESLKNKNWKHDLRIFLDFFFNAILKIILFLSFYYTISWRSII